MTVELPEGTLRLGDAHYPEALRHVPDPPTMLRWRGNVDLLSSDLVAIVGARQCTPAGRLTAETFAAALASLDVCVVSGLAHGIDAGAHRGALSASGATIAVLGSGLDRVYPARNVALAHSMLACGGLLISEYDDETPPAKFRFPSRNRIISGLSRAVVVVEASSRSGSLITARMALEQGRDVLAVPGPIGSAVSEGCFRLIRDGAALVHDVDTLLFELGLEERSVQPALSSWERRVMAALTGQSTTADEVSAQLGEPLGRVVLALTELELRGFVAANSAGYSRRPVT